MFGILGCGPALAVDSVPASVFDLRNWKLQIPGPTEAKNLQNYTSNYFRLNATQEMCFCVNATEKDTTQHLLYVRSELRHLSNWKIDTPHSLSSEFCVISELTPNKVTTLQIHSITEQGEDAPPLLRIAVNNNNLVATIKTDAAVDQGQIVVIKEKIGSNFVKVDVIVTNLQLRIAVDNRVKLTRSLAFWKFNNYFKAGCSPQATQRYAEVVFRKLHVE